MLREEHFISITKGERPNIIYKFHKVNNHLFDLLEYQKFYFASQIELNDPDDLKFILTSEGYYNAVRNSERGELPEYESLSDLLKLEFELKIKQEQKIAGVDITQPPFRICCFTETKEQYMWENYTENHNGICLTINLTNEKLEPGSFKSVLLPVNYVEEDFINYVNNDKEFFTALCTKKKSKWGFENEWRCLSQEKKVKFSTNIISEITFGLNVSESDKNKIKLICSKAGYTCIYTEMT